jgi:hypothetical protein
MAGPGSLGVVDSPPHPDNTDVTNKSRHTRQFTWMVSIFFALRHGIRLALGVLGVKFPVDSEV